jgi:hypothetical protein
LAAVPLEEEWEVDLLAVLVRWAILLVEELLV